MRDDRTVTSGLPDVTEDEAALCMCCHKHLTPLDIGAHRKFINRGSTRFWCKSCLAKQLKVPEEQIDRKIEHFKRQGCLLFQ